MTIESEEKFLALMERLDEQVAGTPLAGRHLRLVCLAVKMHPENAGYPILPDNRAIPDDYTGTSLFAHIKKWCDDRYGSKQAPPINTGRLVLDLKGNRWEVQVPLILLMRKKFVVSYELDGPPDSTRGDLSVINMRRYFVDLPIGLARQLQNEDLNAERALFAAAACAINQLRQCESLEFVSEAIADFRAVGGELAKEHGAFGQCRWASLQFIEKALKALIALIGPRVERTHNLHRLAATASQLGMSELEESDLNLVQCGAGVRYGQPPSTAEEALAAHHASIRLAFAISRALVTEYAMSLDRTDVDES